MEFHIITIFPHIFDSYINESILKRAQKQKLISIKTHTPRQFASDKHRTVDDRPYGGGPGMILMFEPLYKTIKSIPKKKKRKIIMLDPSGEQFTQQKAEEYSRLNQLILLAGRYEGFDARLEEVVDEKISIGPYVLSGGELPALVVVEAVSRLLPGVLGDEESIKNETFSQGLDYIEYPQYTRPEKVKYKGKILQVPPILLSGNHAEIEKWRKQQSKLRKRKLG